MQNSTLKVQIDSLVVKARSAFVANNIQSCCKFLDEAVTLLDEAGVKELPDEVAALTAACIAADKETLAKAEAESAK